MVSNCPTIPFTEHTDQRGPGMPRRRLGFASVVLALALTLASCVTPEELRREDEARCAGYGFHASTDAFASCLQKESLARRYYAPPAPYYWGWGWGLSVRLARTLGTVLPLAGGSEPTTSRT
jgi:hypothetical protein